MSPFELLFIHKVMPETGEATPELKSRQNTVVIVDEVDRSKYGFGCEVNGNTGK